MNIGVISAPRSVLSLRVYGSFCRGDHDDNSDVDVLAVHSTPPNAETRRKLKTTLEGLFDRPVDLAEYSSERVREIFAAGHLFAWHLHAESESLLGEDAFFSSLGKPASYSQAESDSNRFLRLLETIPKQSQLPGSSYIYEAGLAYLASRNIGLIASWQRYKRPDFSRYAILNIAKKLNLRFRLDRIRYDELISCRLATIRGLKLTEQPTLDPTMEATNALIKFCRQVHQIVYTPESA